MTTSFANPDMAGTVGTVTVSPEDAYGNTVDCGPNLYQGTVDLTSTDGQAAGLPASHLFAVADNGSTNCTGVALKTAGTQTITAADSANQTIAGTSPVNVVPAAPETLV